MARTMINDLDMLVSSALSVGKDGVQLFEMPAVINDEPADGEGI